MINYFSNNNFKLKNKQKIRNWLNKAISMENHVVGNINYIFCSDEQLLEINIKYLDHDYYTDIITFDYKENNRVSGDLYLSTDRIIDNAKLNNISFDEEIIRVLIHGILHIIGYNDKSPNESKLMRAKENFYINLYKN
ncbi:rRNA maturation RNase YbeY [Apibacter muscae]|uniref:Endoribonuclease YbeY n=1 Tax=Apibacter muscae TaxID=2509004 RepID=A0A563DGB1_9FLAO|nr:rRNA maturation RNase YbeY [Apibacter muscae]TWP29288.1 rRNA maturation RNase YbeY [Apibacter muscae]TWP31102.1 rRNA maturation RNase YbeY [Apibacter muscae]